MRAPSITRRSFIAGGTLLLSSTLLGFSGISLAGCSKSPNAGAASCTLSIGNGAFTVEPSGTKKTFAGKMISLVSDLRNQTIKIVYEDDKGLEAAEDLCALGEDVAITGSIDVLTIDGVGDEGAFAIDENGSIGVLSLGHVEQVSLAGNADAVIMLGGSDLAALKGSSIGAVSMGSLDDDILIGEGAAVSEVNALASHQISGKAPTTNINIIDDDFAFRLHSEVISDTGVLTISAKKTTQTASGGENASPLQPEKAYADEPSDAAEGASDNTREQFLAETRGGRLIQDGVDPQEDSIPNFPESTAVAQLQNVGIVEELLLSALELIGTAAFDYAFDWGADNLMESLFGKDQSSVEIMAKLDEIKGELDEIEKQVQEILTALQKQLYAQQVDNYLQISVAIRPGIDFLDGMVAQCGKIADPAEREKSQREFALNMLTNEKYKVDGRWITEAAQRLGLELLQVYTSTNKNCLGAFDALLLYMYKWEHQGYEVQENFQQSVLANYVTLLQYARLALMGGIMTYKDDPSKLTEYNECMVWWENLFGSTDQFTADRSGEDNPDAVKDGNAAKVDKMAENQLLRKLDPSLRRYQVIGHEVVLEAQAVAVASDYNSGMQQKQMFFNSEGQPCISRDQAVAIVGDYDNPSIDSIFFSDAEGQFAKPSDFGDEFMYGPVFDEIYEEDSLEDGKAAGEDSSIEKKRKAKWEITRAPGFWPKSEKPGMVPDYYLGLCCCDINPDDGSMVPGTYAFWEQKAWTLFTAKDPRA